MTEETLSRRARAGFGAAGLAVLAAATALVVTGSTQSHEGSTYYVADFGRAGQGLDTKSDVKIRGIAVGGIDSVRLRADGRVAVRLRLDAGYRLPTTAAARIEPVSVFGPKDLTLDLGAGEGRGPYLPDGGEIDETSDPEDLSDVAWPAYRLTKAIDPQDVSTLLHTFSQGLQGQGPALRRTIDNGALLIDMAHGNRAVLRRMLGDVGALSETFENRGDTIVGLVGDANDLTPVLTDRPDRTAQLLDGTAQLAHRVGDTLDRNGAQIAKMVDGGGRLVTVLYQQQHNIPLLIDGINGFFGGIATVIRVPGPENSLLAQAVNFLPVDICNIIVDACGPVSGGGR